MTPRTPLRVMLPLVALLLLGTHAAAAQVTRPAGQAPVAADSLRLRLASVETAVAQLDSLRRGASAVTAEHRVHAAWLADVRRRLQEHATARRRLVDLLGRLDPTPAQRRAAPAQVAQLDRELRALLDDIQEESGVFQTLSSTARTWHEMAKSIIQNIRA